MARLLLGQRYVMIRRQIYGNHALYNPDAFVVGFIGAGPVLHRRRENSHIARLAFKVLGVLVKVVGVVRIAGSS